MNKMTIQRLVLLLMLIICPWSFAQRPSEVNTMPVVIRADFPYYPLLPSGARESGDVVVSLSVDSEGSVVDVKSTGGSKNLRHEAELAAHGWKFNHRSTSLSVVFSFMLYEKGEAQCRPSINFANPIRVEVCEQKKTVVIISDPPLVDLSKPSKR